MLQSRVSRPLGVVFLLEQFKIETSNPTRESTRVKASKPQSHVFGPKKLARIQRHKRVSHRNEPCNLLLEPGYVLDHTLVGIDNGRCQGL